MNKRAVILAGIGGLGAFLYYYLRGAKAKSPTHTPTPTPTPTPISPTPQCKEGYTKCIGHDFYKCANGKWVLVEKNATNCGYLNWIPVKVEIENPYRRFVSVAITKSYLPQAVYSTYSTSESVVSTTMKTLDRTFRIIFDDVLIYGKISNGVWENYEIVNEVIKDYKPDNKIVLRYNNIPAYGTIFVRVINVNPITEGINFLVDNAPAPIGIGVSNTSATYKINLLTGTHTVSIIRHAGYKDWSIVASKTVNLGNMQIIKLTYDYSSKMWLNQVIT